MYMYYIEIFSINCFCSLGSYDSTVRIWDCKSRTYDPIQVMEEAKDSITSLFVSNHEILTG